MNRRVPRSFIRHRSPEWILLAIAVLFALVFAAALTFAGYLFLLSWAGVPLRYILLVALPLAVSAAASFSLARLQVKRHRASC